MVFIILSLGFLDVIVHSLRTLLHSIKDLLASLLHILPELLQKINLIYINIILN